MDLIARVIARSLRADSEDDGPEFEDFIDEVHDGGAAKVPNPNSETREQFPQVSYLTALKNQAFLAKAYKDYQAWAERKRKPAPAPEKKEEKPKAEAPKGHLASPAQVDAVIKKHAKDFDQFRASAKAKVADYKKKPKRDVMDGKTFESLSEAEQELFVAGHEVGAFFEEHVLKDKETHKKVMKAWRAASGDPVSQELLGLLESMGVHGSTPADESKEFSKERKKGPGNKKLKAYIEEVAAFTQAYFKHADIKELTVFRGVDGQGTDKAKKGDKVGIKCREASSFTIDPTMAEAFGNKVLAAKIPVDRVLSSFLTYPDFGSPLAHRESSGGAVGESELMVLGGSDLTFEVHK